MSLVPSLLQAIVRVDGEALVMHAGDKPYVVSPTGQVELANRGLTLDAVSGIVNQMLPAEMQSALNEFGAIQYELPAMPEFPGEHFTVVAARGGDDLWVEIRRQRVADDDVVPEEMFTPPTAAAAVAAAPVAAAPAAATPVSDTPLAAAPVAAAPMADVSLPAAAQTAAEVRQPVVEARAAEAAPSKAPWQAKPLPPPPVTPMADEMTEADLSASLDEDDDLHLPDASQLWPARKPLRGEEPLRESDEIEIDLDADVEAETPVEAAQPLAAAEPIEDARPLEAEQTTPEPEPLEEPQPIEEPQPAIAAAMPGAEPIEELPIAEPVMAAEIAVAPSTEAVAETPAIEELFPVAEPAAQFQEEPFAEPAPFELHEAMAAEEPAAIEEPAFAEVPRVEETPFAEPVAADEPIAVEEPAFAAIPLVEEPVFAAPVAAEAPHAAEPIAAEPVGAEPIAAELPAFEEPVDVPEPIAAEQPAYEEPAVPIEEPIVEPIDEPVAEPLPAMAAKVSQPEAPAAPPVFEQAATVFEQEVSAPIAEPEVEPFPAITVDMPEVEEPVETPVPIAEKTPAAPTVEPVPLEPMPAPLPIAARAATPEPATMPESVAQFAPSAEPRPATRSRLSVAMEKRRAARASAAPPSRPPATPVAPPPSRVYTPEPRTAAPAPSPTMPTPPRTEVVVPPVAPERPSMAASVAPPRPAPVAPTVEAAEPSQPGVVLPIARSPIRADQPPPYVPDPTLSGLERLLRVSAARGASTLYLSSGSRPSVRVDGELQVLEGEPVHVARDVESLLLTLMPERSHEALRSGAATEWIVEIEGVGRVRCMSFRDHLGPGGVFRMMPTRSISADQLALPRQVQALAIEPEGIVLVAGPRSSGKRTLMAAIVDLMNRTRRDHIITIEREINIVHARGLSFISQREVRGHDEEMLTAARAALREDPDVLVIEDLRTGPLMNVALEAAASGRLVIGGFSAHTATGAVDRIIDLYAPEYRRQVQLALADSLRGVIVQTLLRSKNGGRVAAREVLLNTPAVSAVIAEGKTSQLPMAIEGGRRYGMIPLNDALVGLVQNGLVESREAYRRSPDRPGFLAALNRHGLDTSFVERLA